MGVLSCNRSGCTNIMCDRLSDKFGYICNACFDDLCKKYIGTDITVFMATYPHKKHVLDDAKIKYFDAIFRSQK